MPKDTHPTLPAGPELVLPERVTIALAELAGAAREGLLALAVGAGIGVLTVLLDADVERLVGPKGRHNPDRAAVRHGTQPGRATLGGRRVRVDRPRVRTVDGSGEVPLPAWEAFATSELLDQLTLERMLAKLSTRRYQAGLEPVGEAVEQAATGTSKSAVSRRFVAATERALAGLMSADLSGLDLVALMVDGVRVAEHTCVVALGITIDGTKVPLGLAEGATENATVVRDLLASLRDRGLDVTRPILVVLDGAKALRRAVDDVFDHPVVQRCQLHKLRNVTDRLPDALASTVAKRTRRAYHHPDPLLAQAELETLARELARSHPGAAASLREGLAETLTIARLGVPPTLARTLRSTNSIESMIATCRDHAANARALARRADGAALGRRRDGRGPPSSSAASTGTCTWPRCAPRSTPPSLLSHPPRRMPPDHPRGPPPKFHGERDILPAEPGLTSGPRAFLRVSRPLRATSLAKRHDTESCIDANRSSGHAWVSYSMRACCRPVVLDVVRRYYRVSQRLRQADRAGWEGTWTAMAMTQNYLAGELSLLLAQLEAVVTDQASVGDVAGLRREAETRPVTALPSVVARALDLTDGLCWDSLQRGDTEAFSRQAWVGTELREFGVCAGLLEER